MQRQGNYNFVQPYSADNQIAASGYSYDAAGDLLTDGIGDTYTYNVDGRVTSSNGSQYVYDALGQMAAKIGGANSGEIVYFGGQTIAFRDPSSGGYTDLIRAGGRLIAMVAGTQTATPVYRLLNNLGTLAMTTDNSGNVTGTNVMTPYGNVLSSNTSDPYPYAGLMTDTDGTDIAKARKYAVAPARWLRPDPYSGSYDLANPQSMNRYVYAMDNPISNVDPSGLEECTSSTLDFENGTTAPGAPESCSGGGGGGWGWSLWGIGYGGSNGGAGNGGAAGTVAASIAMAVPPSKSCGDQLADMLNDINAVRGGSGPSSAFKGLAQRFSQIINGNYANSGHAKQFRARQRSLQKKIDNYRNSGCGEPPPVITGWANMPVASPWTPSHSQNFSIPSWVGPVAATGAAACAILVPGCFEAEAGAALAF